MAVYAMLFMAAAAMVTGGVIDYVSLVMQKQDVQDAADAAALAAARELTLADNAAERVQDVAQTYVAANYERPAMTSAAVIDSGRAVRVNIAATPRVFFAGPIGLNAKPVKAEAIAELAGRLGNVCVLTLDGSASRALSLESSAAMFAPNCGVYSNSAHAKGLSSLNSAKITGKLICVVGGKEGAASNYSPEPLTDCPLFQDPLEQRQAPPVGACDEHDLIKNDFVGTLSPGVYCGGLQIRGASDVKLLPGVYVIKNGGFRVSGTSKVEGEKVGFYLTGAATSFDFTKDSVISLSAPTSGPMAGLLFHEDRNAPNGTMHRITSDYASKLVGTIYLPRGVFVIDAEQDVAEESEFTVLVVRQLELRQAPRLVLNTDYGGTSVPVPDGVGNRAKTSVRLAQGG